MGKTQGEEHQKHTRTKNEHKNPENCKKKGRKPENVAKKPARRGISKKPTRKSTREENQKMRQASILTYMHTVPGRGGGRERGSTFDSSREEKPGSDLRGEASKGLKTGAKTGEQQQQLVEGKQSKQAQGGSVGRGPDEQTDLRNTPMTIV